MKKSSILSLGISVVALVLTSCLKEHPNLVPTITVKEFASGLNAPIGMDIDQNNWLWVTEAGTGSDDGQVSVFLPNGSKFVAIQNFPSEFRADEGVSVGLNHILIQGNTAWMLHEKGFLFKADVTGIAPGTPPIDWSEVPKEDIGTFAVDYEFEDDTNISNPYNMTFGPNGDLYITDASVNAIIKRDPSGDLSVFATFPRINNPLPVGPPYIEAVPTSIVFDGNRFLVTTLVGFPFPEGKAKIFAVDLNGNVSDYKDGFTTLTDINKVGYEKFVVTEFSRFSLESGWALNSGKLIQVQKDKKTVLVNNLDTPTALVNAGNGIYYVNSFRNGNVTWIKTHGY